MRTYCDTYLLYSSISYLRYNLYIWLYVLDVFNTTTVIYFGIAAYVLTLWSYGVSYSGGVLIPGLCTGAAWGRLVGLGMFYFFPNTVNGILTIYANTLYF